MANVSRSFGFRALNDRGTGAYCGAFRGVIFADTDVTAAFVGDMVKFTGESVEGRDGKLYSVVTIASPTDTRLAGAVQRFDYDAGEDGYIGFRKASTQKIAYIPQERSTVYLVQEDSDGGALTSGAAEGNIDFVAGAGGDTSTFQSSMRLDSSTVAVTGTLPLRIIELDDSQDNEVGNFALWKVQLNQDAYINTTGL